MYRYCPRCKKAKKACICRYITEIQTDIELIILQHPTETQRPMGTARILSLSLPYSRCFVGEDFTDHSELNELLADSQFQYWLIYPCESSVSLETVSEQINVNRAHNGQPKKIRLLIIDGTWKKAYKMWTCSTNLHQLPSLRLPENLTGNYRIRKAPTENSLSTLEAGHFVLSALDLDTDYTPLITAFDCMIDDHINAMPAGTFEKNYKK